MNYYTDSSNHVHAYSDIQSPPAGLTKITEAEALAITNPPPTLAQAQATQQAVIDAAFEAVCSPLIADYPPTEQLSWTTQAREAQAYQADNMASTPMLTAIATARGTTVADLVPLVIANAQAFNSGAAAIGLRQKLRDQIDAATTVEAAQAIEWPTA